MNYRPSHQIFSRKSLKKDSILLVEDNHSMLILLKNILGDDFDVIAFSNTKDAMSWLSEGNSVKAIVSDICMDDFDGIDFAREIYNSDQAESTPFIFLSALDKDYLGDRLLNELYSAYITKPFNPKFLINTIKEVTKGEVEQLVS